MATKAQMVAKRLRLAEEEARKGNLAAARNYAQAAANIQGSGQARVQAVADQYAVAAANVGQGEGRGPQPPADPLPGPGFLQPPAPPTPARNPMQDQLDAMQAELDALRSQRDAEIAAEREAAKAFLTGVLREYNMEGLADQVDELVRTWGRNTAVIAEKLKQTEQYKTRFKGLLGLQQRGITDIRNEAEYLNLETQYRQVFREAGLRDYLGTSGTQTEYDAIASLVSDFSLSVNEVRDRVTDAQRVVAETPQEVRDSLQQFYGIDPALLTQYVLDPENTTTQIQRRANAAIVGGYAQRAGLTFGAGVSERIGEFVGGGEDIRGTAIEPLLTEVSDIQKATRRLADIEKTTLTEEETALSRLDLDQQAREKVRGLQSRERARFGGSSAIKSAALKRPRSI